MLKYRDKSRREFSALPLPNARQAQQNYSPQERTFPSEYLIRFSRSSFLKKYKHCLVSWVPLWPCTYYSRGDYDCDICKYLVLWSSYQSRQLITQMCLSVSGASGSSAWSTSQTVRSIQSLPHHIQHAQSKIFSFLFGSFRVCTREKLLRRLTKCNSEPRLLASYCLSLKNK
jgi:hypothetical protein